MIFHFSRGLRGQHCRQNAAKQLARRSRKRTVLVLGALEARVVPADVYWSIASSGNWDVGANWSTGNVPGSGDDVTISTAAAATVTIGAGDLEAVRSLTTTANDTLAITGGSLGVAAASVLDGPLALTGGALTVAGAGATLTATGETSLSNTRLYAQTGGQLLLPQLTAATSPGEFQATGAGSVLDVSNLATVDRGAGWAVQASGGGLLDLSDLTSLTGAGTWDVSVATGQVNAASLPTTALEAGDRLNLSPSATVTFADNTVTTPAPGGTTFNVPALPAGVKVDLGVAPDYSAPVTFNVGAGPVVSVYATNLDTAFTGGANFNVAAGAIVNLTYTTFSTTYGGTLTGSGGGTVQMSSGTLYAAPGGVTFNFAGDMFQWTGGTIGPQLGDVFNQGTINLSGPNAKILSYDGELHNYGTITQDGTGNLDLHSDNVSPTTLINEAAGTYILKSDSGIDNGFGGIVAVENLGTIEKSGSSGTTYLTINGPLDNTGVIEADSGTLYLNANSVTQISGATLTGGTWKAFNASVLELPISTAITNNAGNLVVGSGSLILGISGLTTNSGSFTVAEGGTFNVTGDLNNSGVITLRGMLNVAANYTQSAGATLNEQVAGQAANQLGQLGIVGTATLDGTFHLDLVNGFTPTDGQDFFVVFFDDVVGNFTAFTGLGANFTTSLNANNLELLYAVPAAADLLTTSVAGPSAVTAGQPVTVTWDVTDAGAEPATGPWQDSVYLSRTPATTPDSVYLGAATFAPGLDAGGGYTGTFTETVPAVAPGDYYFLVQVDSLYQVSDADRSNNVLAADDPVAVSVPALVLGSPMNGAFTAGNQDQYYQVLVPAGGSLQIALDQRGGLRRHGALCQPGKAPHAVSLISGRPPFPVSRTRPQPCHRSRQHRRTTSWPIASAAPRPAPGSL